MGHDDARNNIEGIRFSRPPEFRSQGRGLQEHLWLVPAPALAPAQPRPAGAGGQ